MLLSCQFSFSAERLCLLCALVVTYFRYEKALVSTTQCFTWCGYFFWFLTLAFVYMPFGGAAQDYIRENVGEWAATNR